MATTMTLGDLMTSVRQRADMLPVGYSPSLTSTAYFVTDPELIFYINQSYFELYDLLVATYEDYYVADPVTITLDGSDRYDLPNGTLYSSAPALYKLIGVDLGVNGQGNAWVTLHKFDFISRNRYIYPQLQTGALGVNNLRYRLVGGKIMFIPTPAAGQYVRLWYIPRLSTLTTLDQTLDGISGWTEYVVVDAAIKCLQKEESDITALMAQKMALIKRIEEVAMNRDAGQPDTISDTRSRAETWGGFGGPNFGGSYGGW